MKMAYYINHFSTDSYFNMAFDEWMFCRVTDIPGLILLRLYSWDTGTITYGYNQKDKLAYNHDKLGSTPVIRRITGGRALYHDPSEITYSIAINNELIKNNIFGDTVSENSEIIAKILVRFLKKCGIDSDYKKKTSKQDKDIRFFHKAPCFASNSRNEIVKGNIKIIASAQRRYKGSIFQHGSIKVNGHATHPALPLSDYEINFDNKINILSKSMFENLSSRFVSTFADALNFKYGELIINDDDKSDINFMREYVRNNNLKKRDLFKSPSKAEIL